MQCKCATGRGKRHQLVMVTMRSPHFVPDHAPRPGPVGPHEHPRGPAHLPPPPDHLLELVHPFLETLPGDGARGLKMDLTAETNVFETEKSLKLVDFKGGREILFVGENEDGDGVLAHVVVVGRCALADPLQLQLCFLEPLFFGGVYDKDDAVCAPRVGLP